MTEGEWLACANPQLMLAFLREKVSNRKLRLFACACCRDIWHLMDDPRSRNAVDVTERFADGGATMGELTAVREEATWVASQAASQVPVAAAPTAQAVAAAATAWAAAGISAWGTADSAFAWAATAWAGSKAATSDTAWAAARDATWQRQVTLLRDIVGNPFRPLAFDQALLTPVAISLAQAAYETRADDGTLDPAHLAILADALEEAGCADALTAALRSPGPKFRGCWAVDLVIGKDGGKR